MAIDADEVRSDAQELLDAGAHDRLDTMRHSAAHIMAAAVLELFPEAKLGIGPAIQDGFYYDFDLPRPLTPADLEAIEERMRAAGDGRPAVRAQRAATRPSALDQLGTRARTTRSRSSSELPERRGRSASTGTAPSTTCAAGPHLEATGELGPFKLLNTAGAYWRGDEKRPMLQRIYGTVWETQEELDQHLWRLEEAKKRDHRKLGRELDLFTFHPESPAAPVLASARHGDLARARGLVARGAARGGFDEVRTPEPGRARSCGRRPATGSNYQDNMFVLDDYEHVSGLKPMNCPEEILIYKTQGALVPRAADALRRLLGAFRKERTGALARHVPGAAADPGRLARLLPRRPGRSTRSASALYLVRRQYAPFGFEPRFKLATRPEKRLGSDEFWDMAEGKPARRRSSRRACRTTSIRAAARSTPPRSTSSSRTRWAASGRWRPIQLDYQLPQRFDLEYRAADGGFSGRWSSTTPSTARSSASSAIITEHFAGAFPLWLAPVQVMVIPIADRHLEYAATVRDALAEAGLRAEIDDRSERMQAKLRDAQEQKIPVMLVVGDRDQEAGNVSPRLRTGESSQGVPLDELRRRSAGRAERRELWPYADGGGRGCRAGDRRRRMRKMRGVGQLALASTDPQRVAEFYESAFGFKRRAADESGVDLELSGFELSFRRAEKPNRGRAADRIPARHRQRGGCLGAGADAARVRGRGAAIRRPMGGHALASASPIPRGGRSPSSTPTRTEAHSRRAGYHPGAVPMVGGA